MNPHKHIFNAQETREKRKILRRTQTLAESRVWSKIRNKQFYGYKFFRQYGIGPYIADFYCPALSLALEIDGGQHYEDDAAAYDKERQMYFLELGIKTLRFTNLDVLNNIDGVLRGVENQIARLQHPRLQLPPAPSFPKRGREA